MKKLILVLFLFFFTGCVSRTAPDAVKNYLELYRNHDVEVTDSLDRLIQQENLYPEQENLYRLIMKKQYVNLEYQIVHETYSGNQASIEVVITVYDYIASQRRAVQYFQEHKEDFETDEGIDHLKYKDLQLKYMKEETKRIRYTLTFDCILNENQWEIVKPDYTVIQKIQGVYPYE